MFRVWFGSRGFRIYRVWFRSLGFRVQGGFRSLGILKQQISHRKAQAPNPRFPAIFPNEKA